MQPEKIVLNFEYVELIFSEKDENNESFFEIEIQSKSSLFCRTKLIIPFIPMYVFKTAILEAMTKKRLNIGWKNAIKENETFLVDLEKTILIFSESSFADADINYGAAISALTIKVIPFTSMFSHTEITLPGLKWNNFIEALKKGLEKYEKIRID